MKTPHHFIKFDQGYLHHQRRKQARADRNAALLFGASLLTIGTGALWLVLHIVARTPL